MRRRVRIVSVDKMRSLKSPPSVVAELSAEQNSVALLHPLEPRRGGGGGGGGGAPAPPPGGRAEK
jgi:hypothetical protein